MVVSKCKLNSFLFVRLVCLACVCVSLCYQPALAESQLDLAAQQLQNGYYRAALSSYEQILSDTQQTSSTQQELVAEAGLGHTLYLLNHPQQALIHLQHALNLAQTTPSTHKAQIHYYLNLVYAQLKNQEKAAQHWTQAMNTAKQETNLILQAYLHLSAIKSAIQLDSLNQAFTSLDTLLQTKNKRQQDWGIIYLNAAEHRIRHRLLGSVPVRDRQRIRQSYQYLHQAQKHTPKTALRPQAQIAGLTGQLYEIDGRHEEALALSVQALSFARKANAKDLLMLYEWQAGRLYKQLGQSKAALDSYRRAVSYVEAIRQDIPVQYQDGKSSFKELLGPIYLGLVDLILQEAPIKPDDQQSLLHESRDILEKLKQTELEDFFQDRCLIQAQAKFSLDNIRSDTVVLYPVILPDRFEWLVSHNGKLQQIKINHSMNLLDLRIRTYTTSLRNGYKNQDNQKLYNILFKPLEPFLQQQKIKTLVYIPDGVLRLLPLSVLSDGKQYLIERYAIATIPGLNLLNAKVDSSKIEQSLLVGLSQPTVEAVSQLPQSMLSQLGGYSPKLNDENQRGLKAKNRSINPPLSSIFNQQSKPVTDIKVWASQQHFLEGLTTAFTLPGVTQEIKQIAKGLPNQTLLNQQFTLDNFQQQASLENYGIVHIASHGFFSGDSKDSFIMTYDKLLTIDQLEDLLRGRNPNRPVNMLTLSACQTAEGDDRAPLGLSGVAIKANAQTALGSLWPISDTATVKLMDHFYQQLIQHQQGKAKALQFSQQQLIKDPKTNHPFYWAPFILVGHWD